MATTQEIGITRGESKALRFNMRPVVDITGWVLSFTIVKKLDSPTKVTQQTGVIVSGPSGIFDILLPRSVTLLIDAGTYYFDVWRTNAGEENPVADGKFVVKGSAF